MLLLFVPQSFINFSIMYASKSKRTTLNLFNIQLIYAYYVRFQWKFMLHIQMRLNVSFFLLYKTPYLFYGMYLIGKCFNMEAILYRTYTMYTNARHKANTSTRNISIEERFLRSNKWESNKIKLWKYLRKKLCFFASFRTGRYTKILANGQFFVSMNKRYIFD